MPRTGVAMTDDRKRAQHAEDGVRRHRDRGEDQRHLQRVHRVRSRDRVPGRADAVLEGPPEDVPDRRDEQHREIAEREDSGARTYRSCFVTQRRSPPIASSTRERDQRG